jgi:Holliday junction resolvase RusA-like endonuclease
VTVVAFNVYGHPAPQGSKRHVGRGVMVESSKAVKPWREAVKAVALDVMDGRPALDGPLRVRMVFTLRKPATAPKRRRTWPDRTPDLSKLARATEDALTEAGVWSDDARVVQYDRLAKVFPGEDAEALHIPGVCLQVEQIVDPSLLACVGNGSVELVG